MHTSACLEPESRSRRGDIGSSREYQNEMAFDPALELALTSCYARESVRNTFAIFEEPE
jgi:hypothetical protein